tara:strand:- start:738 stop:869 length:132 start_codon:yes stop_codon:yes gene_type:complete
MPAHPGNSDLESAFARAEQEKARADKLATELASMKRKKPSVVW